MIQSSQTCCYLPFFYFSIIDLSLSYFLSSSSSFLSSSSPSPVSLLISSLHLSSPHHPLPLLLFSSSFFSSSSPSPASLLFPSLGLCHILFFSSLLYFFLHPIPLLLTSVLFSSRLITSHHITPYLISHHIISSLFLSFLVCLLYSSLLLSFLVFSSLLFSSLLFSSFFFSSLLSTCLFLSSLLSSSHLISFHLFSAGLKVAIVTTSHLDRDSNEFLAYPNAVRIHDLLNERTYVEKVFSFKWKINKITMNNYYCCIYSTYNDKFFL